MAYQRQYPHQAFPHQASQQPINYNNGPAGDQRGSQRINGSFPPQHAAGPPQQNGMPLGNNATNRLGGNPHGPPPVNGEVGHLQNQPGPPPPTQKVSGNYTSNPAQNSAPSSYYNNPTPSVTNYGSGNVLRQVAQNQPPPISGHQFLQASTMNGPPASGQSPLGMPLHGSSHGVSPAQHQMYGSRVQAGLSGPPLPGQQFKSSTPPPGGHPPQHSPASSVQGQSARSTPTHVSQGGHPPNMWTSQHQPSNTMTQTGVPPVIGQQVASSSASMPPISSQHGSAMPPLPGQPYASQGGIGAPPLPGQQYTPRSGIGAPPMPGQQYTSPSNTSGPPMSGQQLAPSSGTGGPLLPGQQYISQTSVGKPPLPGNQYTSPSGVGAPPLPGQQYQGQPPAPSSAGPGYPPSSSQNPTGYPTPPGQPGSISNRQPMPGAPGAYPGGVQGLSNSMGHMGISDANRPINLMTETRILPPQKPIENPLRFETTADRGVLVPPNRKNCKPDVLRCTLKALPHNQAMLNKVKLPLGLVIHPFKDLSSLPVISAGTIVRCKRCRTYINPFVSFIDERRWRCNMCFAVNDTPDEFLHHPVTKTYGQPHTRPECTNSTIEFIAPQEYMLRPPQPAVYLFLMDVSHSAIESGYLKIVCDVLLDHLEHFPGDTRTRVGFLTYNGTVHFYRLSEGLAQPQMIIVSDIDDVFVPTPENLLVNLRESKDLVQDLLHQLPAIHNLNVEGEVDTYSALGAALEVAKKLMAPFGGRVTVFQQSMPSAGPGKLVSREDPNMRAGEVPTASLNPSTDFYKKFALDCSAHQIAIDFFFFNSQYIDIATLSCSSRFSAGDLHYYPSLHVVHNPMEAERLSHDLERYLTRKIGFESVMRIRCTKGLSVHTFHGNFFVRSTDLLSLANVNPDSGYAVNLTIEDPLTDLSAACFQAALLYTTSKGERRIRVHTMCIPVVKTAAEVLNSVDCVAVVSLLSKMGVDRSVTASVSDARDALVNAVIDPLKAYKESLPQGMTVGGLYVPRCMRLLPLYVHCMLKHPAFRAGVSTRLDDRVFSMINFKMQPASYFLQDIHPDLYRVDDLNDEACITVSNREVPQPDILPLSAESISQMGTFLLDCGWKMYLLVGRSTNQTFINDVLGVAQFSSIEDPVYSIPELENPTSELFHSFIEFLQDTRPHHAPIRVIRDDSRERLLFMSYLRQDRSESSMSLQEFHIHIQQKLNKA